MIQLKKKVLLYLNVGLYHKVSVISMVRKMFFGEKDTSISSIVNQAIDEYLKNHDEEIRNMMDRYHKEGGCGTI